MIKIFVVDTNVLISANLSVNSANRKAFERAREIGVLIYSKETLSEFFEAFSRPKFDKYISKERRLSDVSTFRNVAHLIDVSVKINACRDAKDNKFLELAVEAGATCIITGDADLLVLHPFENIPILTAPDFLVAFPNF